MGDKRLLSTEDYETLQQVKTHALLWHVQGAGGDSGRSQCGPDPFREKISRLVDAGWEQRYTKRLNRYIKKATLKYPNADLDETIYDPERQMDYHVIEELSKCEWIDQGWDLVITGQTGFGKTYIANALCISVLRQFKNVRYIRTSQLIDDLSGMRHSGPIGNRLLN